MQLGLSEEELSFALATLQEKRRGAEVYFPNPEEPLHLSPWDTPADPQNVQRQLESWTLADWLSVPSEFNPPAPTPKPR